MKSSFIVLIVCFVFGSCATVINSSNTAITFHTTKPSSIVVLNDTVQTTRNAVKVMVPRSKESLPITIMSDSSRTVIQVRSRNAFEYYANLFCNYGLGMLVDKHNPKRYVYPKNVYTNSWDTSGRYSTYTKPTERKGFRLRISLPHINYFHLKPTGELPKSNVGFWGFAAGVEYFYERNKALSFTANAASDFFLPVPAAVDISGEYELMSTIYLALANSYQLNHFRLGYGLCYAKNTWNFKYYDSFNPPPPTRAPVKKTHAAIGFVFPLHYYVSDQFFVGFVYRPTNINLSNKVSFMYEHLLSAEFGFSLAIR